MKHVLLAVILSTLLFVTGCGDKIIDMDNRVDFKGKMIYCYCQDNLLDDKQTKYNLDIQYYHVTGRQKYEDVISIPAYHRLSVEPGIYDLVGVQSGATLFEITSQNGDINRFCYYKQ